MTRDWQSNAECSCFPRLVSVRFPRRGNCVVQSRSIFVVHLRAIERAYGLRERRPREDLSFIAVSPRLAGVPLSEPCGRNSTRMKKVNPCQSDGGAHDLLPFRGSGLLNESKLLAGTSARVLPACAP